MTSKPGVLRSALGHVRGLGSAKEGTHHWWQQRLTAVAMVPLSIWLIASIVSLADAGYEGFVNWFRNPIQASIMVLFLIACFHHAQLGMQVVIEDYVPGHAARTVCVTLVKFACLALAVLCTVSILVVAFKG
jgi:succinate dehydrogenase / fumarate reductase, membrane anchor subunit